MGQSTSNGNRSGYPFKKRHKVLTNDEQVELCRRWQQEQDHAARDRLVISTHALVLKILNGHIYVSQQDAYQNAMYRIHRAIDLFDLSAKVKFISYVKFYILHGIYDTMQEDHSLNLPLWAINARNKQTRAQKKLEEEGVPSVRAAQIAYYEHDPKNLRGCITTGQDVDRTQNLQTNQPEEKETISLSPITDPTIRLILRLRYGFYGPIWKMKHIGRIFGITRQRVEQLQRRGLMAMRQHADD